VSAGKEGERFQVTNERQLSSGLWRHPCPCLSQLFVFLDVIGGLGLPIPRRDDNIKILCWLNGRRKRTRVESQFSQRKGES
jgi:hypothetical protein